MTNVIDTARAEGEARGEARGEVKSQTIIARNLLDILDDETIAQKTGLSMDEVRKITMLFRTS